MRKHIISTPDKTSAATEDWLALEHAVQIEVTSEDPAHPVESALLPEGHGGWRAAEPGVQTLLLLFDAPHSLRHVQLKFIEPDMERTQEFVLRYLPKGEGAFREIVRQQWTFSPQGGTSELEDYHVELPAVTALELTIVPDISRRHARASLASLRVRGAPCDEA